MNVLPDRPLPFYVHEQDAPAKREILQAALALFVRHGIDGTTIRDIAAKAGYTNPALFKHFDSKDELSRYLFVNCYRELAACLFHGINDAAPFLANLELLVMHATDFTANNLDAFLYVQDNLRHFWPQVASELDKPSIWAQLRELLGAGRAQGVVATDISVELQVTALSGTLSQFARALYFKEIKENAHLSAPALVLLLERMLRG